MTDLPAPSAQTRRWSAFLDRLNARNGLLWALLALVLVGVQWLESRSEISQTTFII